MGIFKSDYYDNIEFVFRRQKKETEKVDTDFTADCIKDQLWKSITLGIHFSLLNEITADWKLVKSIQNNWL